MAGPSGSLPGVPASPAGDLGRGAQLYSHQAVGMTPFAQSSTSRSANTTQVQQQGRDSVGLHPSRLLSIFYIVYAIYFAYIIFRDFGLDRKVRKS